MIHIKQHDIATTPNAKEPHIIAAYSISSKSFAETGELSGAVVTE